MNKYVSLQRGTIAVNGNPDYLLENLSKKKDHKNMID